MARPDLAYFALCDRRKQTGANYGACFCRLEVNVSSATISSNAAEFKAAISESIATYGFATIVALTRAARATTQEFLPAEVNRVFDRPTPWIQNAFYYQPATADKTSFEIGVKNFGGSGNAASNILQAEIEGGERKPKRSEILLAQLIGRVGYWVPGPGMRLDAYGNVPGSTMQRILSDLQIQFDSLNNRSARSMKRNKRYANTTYFIPKLGSNQARKAFGVWVNQNGVIQPALIFIQTPQYQQRFDFFGRGMAFAEERFLAELDIAIKQGYNGVRD